MGNIGRHRFFKRRALRQASDIWREPSMPSMPSKDHVMAGASMGCRFSRSARGDFQCHNENDLSIALTLKALEPI